MKRIPPYFLFVFVLSEIDLISSGVFFSVAQIRDKPYFFLLFAFPVLSFAECCCGNDKKKKAMTFSLRLFGCC